MTCEVCTFFIEDIADSRYLHALKLHLRILHKAIQWDDCEDCKEITSSINEDQLRDQRISLTTLKMIKEHIKTLHEFGKGPLRDLK
ncbi:MAG: hypothetical protein WA364_21535 [Candidatus Nitrosopolaris sp.]